MNGPDKHSGDDSGEGQEEKLARARKLGKDKGSDHKENKNVNAAWGSAGWPGATTSNNNVLASGDNNADIEMIDSAKVNARQDVKDRVDKLIDCDGLGVVW